MGFAGHLLRLSFRQDRLITFGHPLVSLLRCSCQQRLQVGGQGLAMEDDFKK